MPVTIFNLKKMQGGILRFSLKFETPEGMPLIKIHGWRLMPDASLISPSTFWGGRNNAMSEIPTWQIQKLIIDQVRSMESQGLAMEYGPKKKPRYKLPKSDLDERDYRKSGVIQHNTGELVGPNGVACNCRRGRDGWKYAVLTREPCSCHFDPKKPETSIPSKASDEMEEEE